MNKVTTPAQAARQQLPDFQGRLIGPDDPDYEDAPKKFPPLGEGGA
jgi:hypothetical protein